MTRAIAIVLALGACWRDSKPAEPPPAPPSPCAQAATAMLDVLHVDAHDANRGKLDAALARRCTDDRWPAVAVKCIIAVKTDDELRRCGDALTPEQRKATERDAAAIDPKFGRKKRDERPAAVVRITSVEPAAGDATGGTYVKIYGNGFTCNGGCARNAKVYFGSRQAMVARFANDRELVVQAPGGTSGDVVDVLVMFEPGGEITIPKAFTYR